MTKFTDGQRVRVTAINGRSAELTIFEDEGMTSVIGDKQVMFLLFGYETGAYPANGKQIKSIGPAHTGSALQMALWGAIL